jgi:hypothetical protein
MDPDLLELWAEILSESAPGKWLVRLIAAGKSLNGNVYSRDVLTEAVPLFEGRAINLYEAGSGRKSHLPDRILQAVQGGFIQATVGVLKGVRWDDAYQGLIAEAVLVEGWFSKLLEKIAEAAGAVKAFGLSIRADGAALVEGGQRLVQKITAVHSVDVVTTPAAGGAFLEPLIEEVLREEQKESDMDPKQLAELVRQALAEALGGITPLSEERVTQIVAEAVATAVKGATSDLEAQKTALAEALKQAETAKAEAAQEKLIGRVRTMCDTVMSAYSEATRGAVVSVVMMESAAEDDDEKIRGRVKAFADALPKPVGPAGRVQVLRESIDKLAAGMAGLMGVATQEEAKIGPAFRGLRHAYREYTNDSDMVGDAFAALREDVQLSTSFTVALGNAMHRRLMREFNAEPWNELRLVTPPFDNLNDFRARNVISIGGAEDIPQITGEVDPYEPRTLPGEESSSYSPDRYGELFLISWVKYRNDDIRLVIRELDDWALAARRTRAKAIFGALCGTVTMDYDSTALFDATHSNTAATSFGYDAIVAGDLALFGQTKPHTDGEKLRTRIKDGGLMVIPIDLEQTAAELLKARGVPGSDYNDGSATEGWFGPPEDRLQRVVVNPFAASSTYWYLQANPQRFETIVLGFLDGRQEPELLSANSEQSFDMWFRDAMAWKIRYVFGVKTVSHRYVYRGGA